MLSLDVEDGGIDDLSDFEGLPPQVALNMIENGLAVDCANEAAVLQCSVIDVLDSWNIRGPEREDLLVKIKTLVAANNKYDRDRIEKAQQQRESAGRK